MHRISIYKGFTIVLAIVMQMGLVACATGPLGVELKYPPREKKIEENKNVKSDLSSKNKIFVVVVDERAEPKNIVGITRNIAYVPLGDVVINDSPIGWVQHAIEAELKKHGFQISNDKDSANQILKIGINKIWTELVFRVKSEIILSASSISGSSESPIAKFVGKSSVNGIGLKDIYQQGISLALYDAGNQIADSFFTQLKK